MFLYDDVGTYSTGTMFKQKRTKYLGFQHSIGTLFSRNAPGRLPKKANKPRHLLKNQDLVRCLRGLLLAARLKSKLVSTVLGPWFITQTSKNINNDALDCHRGPFLLAAKQVMGHKR